MELQVKNFGKIKEADIQINGITLIAGENNTGKSILGKILYCLFDGFHNLSEKVIFEKKKGILTSLMDDISFKTKYFSQKDETYLQKIIDKIYIAGLENYGAVLRNEDINISKESADKIDQMFTYNIDKLEALIINSIFNREFNGQIIPVGKIASPTSVSLSIKNQKMNIDFLSNKNMSIKDKLDLYKDGFYMDNPFILDKVKYTHHNLDRSVSFVDFWAPYTENHNDKLENRLSFTLKQQKSSLIQDAILEERFEPFIKRIQSIIGGDIIEKDNEFIFVEKDTNNELALSNLSTGIKTFSIILKLIKNYDITDKSLIVLDEPEIHLHPKWQVDFAELLVLLQKQFDLNIVITSHSPYFINALEVFSSKYSIADKCKYYLSTTDKSNKSLFEDVTTDIDKIYHLLAQPLLDLEDIV